MGVYEVHFGVVFVPMAGEFLEGQEAGVRKFVVVVLGVRRQVRRFLWL